MLLEPYEYNSFSGSTTSRLDEVKSYNINDPYPIGVSDGTGIISVSGNTVFYIIDYINYATNINTNETYFSLIYNYDRDVAHNYINFGAIKNEDDGLLVSPINLDKDIDIDRFNISVFDKIHKLSNIKNIGAIEKFGGGIFNVQNNT